MIEVFKTNISEKQLAERILDEIHKVNTAYQANFDLQDCDKILRVVSANGYLQTPELIELIKNMGYHVEILPDN